MKKNLLIIILVISTMLGVIYGYHNKQRADEYESQLEMAENLAEQQRKIAEEQLERAQMEAIRADSALHFAMIQRDSAEAIRRRVETK